MTLSCTEDFNAGSYSRGDSRGGVFIMDGFVWKTEIVNYRPEKLYVSIDPPPPKTLLASL